MPTFERIGMLPFETKSFDPSSGIFEGLASTPEVDRIREVVSTEAMLEAAERYMKNPVITDHHGAAIGRGLAVDVSDTGTLLRGYITDKTQQGRDIRGLLEDKILRSLSIGFSPYSHSYGPHPDGVPDYELVPPSTKPETTTGYGYGPWYSENEDTVVWKRIDWMETAICAIPCNPSASISLAKSIGLIVEPVARPGEEAEQERFLSDLDRFEGAWQAIRNIDIHWQRENKALAGEYRDRLVTVHEQLGVLLQPHVAAAQVPAPEGALSLPEPPGVSLLPVPQSVPLPG